MSKTTIPLFQPPPHLPAFIDPRVELALIPTEFLGASLRGSWSILLWWLALLFLSNLGEELVWRGYILPREELSLGRWAWVVSGLLWNLLVLAVLKWQYPGMLPSMLLVPWLAQRTKNTWVGIISVAVLGGAYLVLHRETHLLGIQISDRPLTPTALMVFFGLLAGVADPARKLSGIYGTIFVGTVPGLATGDEVIYKNNGGDSVEAGGIDLVDGGTYYVIVHGDGYIQLASSEANALAGTALNLTDIGDGSNHVGRLPGRQDARPR